MIEYELTVTVTFSRRHRRDEADLLAISDLDRSWLYNISSRVYEYQVIIALARRHKSRTTKAGHLSWVWCSNGSHMGNEQGDNSNRELHLEG